MSEPVPFGHGRRALTVRQVIDETPQARSFVLDVPAADAGYRPGQFLTVRIPGQDAESAARCYSLSSSPHTDRFWKVTVKRVRDGRGSNWLCDNVAAGSTLEVLTPAGTFSPPDLDADLLLIAGGSGITPVMSILKSALAAGSGQITLLYANQDERSVIFAGELHQLAQEHAPRLAVLHWLESVQGVPSQQALTALLSPYREREIYVCGPGPLMDVTKDVFNELDAPRKRVHFEKFVSLTQDPFQAGRTTSTSSPEVSSPEADSPEADSSTTRSAKVRVALDGEQHTFSWDGTRVLLDLLLDNGLDAPFSCRQGACSACACRIESGEVTMRHNEVLQQQDLDEGVVLACQSLPASEEINVSYE